MRGVSRVENKMKAWLNSGKHLPVFLRDFHDQKSLFKSMHYLYQDEPHSEKKPNWVDGQIYIIDWFLWFMASRGYTLQKTKAKQEFMPIPKYNELIVPSEGEPNPMTPERLNDIIKEEV